MDLFKRTTIKKTIFFTISDIFLIAFSVWAAFLIRFDGNIPQEYFSFLPSIIMLTVLFVICVFYIRKMYAFSWSYVSSNELISLFVSTTLAFILLAIAIFISDYFPRFTNFPRSTLFISYILVFILCGALRLAKRMYLHITWFNKFSGKEKTLIAGAGDAGEQILRNMLSLKENRYFVAGFIDDNPIKQGVIIHGVKVLGRITDIPDIVRDHHIKELIIALPSASNKIIKEAVQMGREAGLKKIKIAPKLDEIIRGEVSLKNLKDVDVEDLLGRESIQLDKKQIENFTKNKVILITGAAGSIGSELARQVARFNPSALLILDQDETGVFHILGELKKKFPELAIKYFIDDIQDKEKMQIIFKDQKPEVVFHAAAYKHVPLMQEHPDQAVKNNILGTEVLANACLDHDVEKFVFISTDKAVNPTSVMGATKRIGEMLCRAYNQKNKTKFISVRFGNVLNSRGSVIPIFKEQIRMGGPVEVTHPDMQRYFMLTSEACLLVMQAGALGNGGETFVLDMGKPIKIVDLAREMIRLSGFKPDKDIPIVFVGPRPGEKLFEEILTAEEGTVVTQNQKIFIAKTADVSIVDMEKNLALLKELSIVADRAGIMQMLKRITPYYQDWDQNNE